MRLRLRERWPRGNEGAMFAFSDVALSPGGEGRLLL